jgi:hypothetical protein
MVKVKIQNKQIIKMKNLMSFENFTQRVKTESEAKVIEKKTMTQKSMGVAFENLLREFDVTNPSEITEEQKSAFMEKLFSAEAMNELANTSTGSELNEADIKSDDEFREYVNTILKQQHPDDFDEAKAKEVADGLLAKKKGDDYGALVGMLNKG